MQQTEEDAKRSPLDVTPDTIEQYRAGKVGRIVRDLDTLGLPQDETFRVLLARGVGQAFWNRRDLFWLRFMLKTDLAILQAEQRLLKNQMTPLYTVIKELRGRDRAAWTEDERKEWREWRRLTRTYLRNKGSIYALTDMYAVVRRMTEHDRWRVPGHDATGDKLLRELTEATRDEVTAREQYRFESHWRRYRAWQTRETNRFRVDEPLAIKELITA